MAEDRLLAACAFPPWPVTNGYVVRVAHLLSGLSRAWRITLLSPRTLEGGSWPVAGRLESWHEVDVGVFGGPLARAPDARSGLRRALGAALTERPFEAALLWGGTEFLADALPGEVGVVWDRIDCLTLQHARRLRAAASPREWLRGTRALFGWARHERRALRRVSETTVVGEDDARALRRLSPSRASRVHVVPNGVELKAFAAEDEAAPRPTVAFTGVLAYPPNVAAATHLACEVWPAVRERVPGARLLIAGRKPIDPVRALEREPGVEVRADVESMERVLREAWVVAAPMLSGSGVKNKVLEAWAVGRPVVMYPLAANGLLLDDLSRRLVVDGASEMAHELVGLLTRPERRERYARAAHGAARSQGWERATRRMTEILRLAAGRGEGRKGA